MQQIPMLDLRRQYEHMKQKIDGAIARCLEHQRWILGPEVEALEKKLASYLGVSHCIGVSSGTEALTLTLRALAISRKGREYFDKNDRIVTTSFTFTATGDAILRAKATPVFVDIDPSTYNIDASKLEYFIESTNENVVGVIPVHLYGLSCNMGSIMDLARKNDLFVLEDVAQAFGGSWMKSRLGSIGTAGAFSFFPSKNLGGFGDGGFMSTNDDRIAEIVRMLLKHGGKDKYNVDHIGYNARLDTLQAAVLLAKLDYIEELNEKRRKIASRYDEGLRGCPGILLPSMLSKGMKPEADPHHVFHQYTIRSDRRDELMGFLKSRCVSTMVYYPMPLHKMKVFAGRAVNGSSLDESEKASREVLSLPMEPLMTDAEIDYVIESVTSFK